MLVGKSEMDRVLLKVMQWSARLDLLGLVQARQALHSQRKFKYHPYLRYIFNVNQIDQRLFP